MKRKGSHGSFKFKPFVQEGGVRKERSIIDTGGIAIADENCALMKRQKTWRCFGGENREVLCSAGWSKSANEALIRRWIKVPSRRTQEAEFINKRLTSKPKNSSLPWLAGRPHWTYGEEEGIGNCLSGCKKTLLKRWKEDQSKEITRRERTA